MSYGVDNFTTIGLFYLMIAPLPDCCSADARLGFGKAKPADLHGLHRRVLQLHLCLVYCCGGLTKALGPAWWNGESIWRAVTRAPFNVISPHFWAWWEPFLPLLGVGVFLLELGYPFFIWSKTTRPIWLVSILAMHVGIALAMGLYLFSLIMIVLNLAAFGSDLPLFDRAVSAFRARRSTTQA